MSDELLSTVVSTEMPGGAFMDMRVLRRSRIDGHAADRIAIWSDSGIHMIGNKLMTGGFICVL